jgi:hypothetical protein
MPVRLDKIKAERGRHLRDRIVEFLEKDRAQAYTSVEIALGLHGHDPATTTFFAALVDKDQLASIVEPCQQALGELVDQKRVIAHQFDGMNYFSLPER